MEAKNKEEEGDGDSIEVHEVLPLIEVAAVLVIGRYTLKCKG